MSLVHFVERPAIREAFKRFAAPVRLDRTSPLLVPSVAKSPSLVGTAFDYLARFRLAHEIMVNMKGQNVPIVDKGWVAERSVEAMRDHPELGRHHARYARQMKQVRSEVLAYMRGDAGRLPSVIEHAQWLARLDSLYRCGQFQPFYKPNRDVHEELEALNAVFRPLEMLRPRGIVLLNPTFAAAGLVGGADPDIVVDDALVDMKTVGELRAEAASLRQLAGYAVMQTLGGLPANGGTVHDRPFRSVGLLFTRHGVLAQWPLDELFPNGGFERFAEAFRAELKAR